MKVYRVVITETVKKTYEIGVKPDESASHVADTVYQLYRDNLEGKVISYELTKIDEVNS